jgi:DNA-binding beta-propeller fold protein YncE
MLRTFFCLLVAAISARAAIEVVKVPGVEELRAPANLAFDAQGGAYVAESMRGNRIFRWHEGRVDLVSGVRWDSAPKGMEPPAPAKALDLAPAVYQGPQDIAVAPDGSIYVCDSLQHRIVRLDPKTHAATVFAGTGRAGFAGDGGPAERARFNIPTGGVLDPTGKFLIVADLGNHRIRRIDLATRVVTTLAGNGQKGFPQEGADALASPFCYVRTACVAAEGTVYALFGSVLGGHSLVAIKDGKVGVVVNRDGQPGPVTEGPAATARLNFPKYATLDAMGGVLILDTENHCLRRYDPVTRTIRTIAGNGAKGSAVGADWAATQLNRPQGARLGPDGRLYVADTGNNRILVGPAP